MIAWVAMGAAPIGNCGMKPGIAGAIEPGIPGRIG
jgi:hypothetical protein